MSDVKWSVLVTGIGIPLLDRCLQSIAEQEDKPDEVIICIDTRGRALAGLPELYFDSILYKCVVLGIQNSIVVYNVGRPEWHIANQTINEGLAACTTDLCMVLHEDAAFHNPRVCGYVRRDLERMTDGIWGPWNVEGKNVTGICGPLWSNMQKCWSPGVSGPMIMQEYAGSSTVLRRDFWERFPLLYDGVWYDARWQQALIDNDLWLVCDPRVRIIHDDTESLKANEWGKSWGESPLWGQFGAKFDEHFDRWFARAADRHLPMSPRFLG